jgi:hypothetical protein
MAVPGRKNAPQVIHEVSIQLNAAQLNAAASGQFAGAIPGSGAFLLMAHFVTSVAFDPTTITLSLGSTPGGSQILAAQNIKALGRTDIVLPAASAGVYLTDTPVYWTVAMTGGPATVGLVTVWLEYLPTPG